MEDKNPDDFDNAALDAVFPHVENYWQLVQSCPEPVTYGDPIPQPADEPDGPWTVGHHDIKVASFQLAMLLFGPDNGSMNRDYIECQMQEVMKIAFGYTTVREP